MSSLSLHSAIVIILLGFPLASFAASRGETAFVHLVDRFLHSTHEPHPGGEQKSSLCDGKGDEASSWISRERVRVSTWPDRVGDLTVLTEAEANYLFNEVAMRPELAPEWTSDGCSQRVNVIGQILQQNGVRSARIWIDASEKNPIKILNRLSGQVREWNFHTATSVLVQTKDGIKERVFDPALFDHPVSPIEWERRVKALSPEVPTTVTHHRWRDLYGPRQKFDFKPRFDAEESGANYETFLNELSKTYLQEYRKRVDEVRGGKSAEPVCKTCYDSTLKRLRRQNQD